MTGWPRVWLQMMEADTCVILSDIDGLYTADPTRDDTAEHIARVEAITPEIEAMAGETAGDDGSGGMITKIEAARVAMQAGCRMVISDGRDLHPLRRLIEGERATWFLPQGEPQTARKRWIAGAQPGGYHHCGRWCGESALARGKSLLPAGVTRVDGTFHRGDPVVVKAGDGTERARGLVAYDSKDACRIVGRRSDEIEGILGYRGREEMIHRDDLVES